MNYYNDERTNSSRRRNPGPGYRQRPNRNQYPPEYPESYRDGRTQRDGSGYRENEYADYPNYYPPRRSRTWPIVAGIAVLGAAAIAGGVYFLMPQNDLAQIVTVTPKYLVKKVPYQSCHKVATTTYVQNQKNGTTGTLIGGATGAVAGGVIGNQIAQGGGGTAVGAIVGGATGALIGREVQRSNQPDYVAQKGSTTKCGMAYKSVKAQDGYTVQYLYKNNMATLVTQNAPAVGAKLPLNQLQALAIPAQ